MSFAGRWPAGSLGTRDSCCPDQNKPLISQLKSAVHCLRIVFRFAASVHVARYSATPCLLVSIHVLAMLELSSGLLTIYEKSTLI